MFAGVGTSIAQDVKLLATSLYYAGDFLIQCGTPCSAGRLAPPEEGLPVQCGINFGFLKSVRFSAPTLRVNRMLCDIVEASPEGLNTWMQDSQVPADDRAVCSLKPFKALQSC